MSHGRLGKPTSTYSVIHCIGRHMMQNFSTLDAVAGATEGRYVGGLILVCSQNLKTMDFYTKLMKNIFRSVTEHEYVNTSQFYLASLKSELSSL